MWIIANLDISKTTIIWWRGTWERRSRKSSLRRSIRKITILSSCKTISETIEIKFHMSYNTSVPKRSTTCTKLSKLLKVEKILARYLRTLWRVETKILLQMLMQLRQKTIRSSLSLRVTLESISLWLWWNRSLLRRNTRESSKRWNLSWLWMHLYGSSWASLRKENRLRDKSSSSLNATWLTMRSWLNDFTSSLSSWIMKKSVCSDSKAVNWRKSANSKARWKT